MAELQDVVKQLKTNQQANETSIRQLRGTFEKHFLKLERTMLDQLEEDIEAKNRAKKQTATTMGATAGGGGGGIGLLPGIMTGLTQLAAGLTALGLAAAGLRGWELPLIKKLKNFFTNDKKGSFGRLFAVTLDSFKDTMQRRVGMLKDIWGKDPEKSLSARIKAWFNGLVQRMRKYVGMDFAEADAEGKKLNFKQQAMKWFDNLRKGFLRQLGISMETPDGKKANVGRGTILQQVRAFFRNESDRVMRMFGLTMENVDKKTGKFTSFTVMQKIRNAFTKETTRLLKFFGIGEDVQDVAQVGAAAGGVMSKIRGAFDRQFTKIMNYFGLNPKDYAPKNPGRILAALGDTAGGVLDKIRSAFRSLFKPVIDVFKGIKGFFVGTIGKGIADFLRPITKFGAFLGKIFAPIGMLFSLFAGFEAYQDEEGGFFKKLKAGIAGAVADFFGAPLDLIIKIGAWIVDKLGFSDTAKSIKEWQKESGGITGILDRFMRKILGLLGDGVDWVLGLFPTMAEMKAAGKAVLGAFKFDFTNPLPLIGEKIAGMLQGLASYAYDSRLVPDALGDWATEMADSIKNSWGAPVATTAKISKKEALVGGSVGAGKQLTMDREAAGGGNIALSANNGNVTDNSQNVQVIAAAEIDAEKSPSKSVTSK